MIAAGQSCRQLAHKSIWTITDNYLGLWGLIICYGERPVADTPEWTNLNEKQEMHTDWEITLSRPATDGRDFFQEQFK